MRIRSRLAILLLAISMLAGTLAVPLASVSAASNSLGVNPRRDYTIKSGDKVSDTVAVTNLSKTDNLNITISVEDFGPKDETGTPTLLLGEKEPARWSIKPFVTIQKTAQIPAGKSVQIPFTIAIPANVGAGSYYGAIKYSAGAGEQSDKNVSLTSSSATLVFVRVPGEAKSALLLKQFGAFTPNADGTSGAFGKLYATTPPKYLSYRVANIGNIAEQPSGSAVVKNIFGRQVKLFQNANPNKNLVLIGQTRRIDLCFNEQKVAGNKDIVSNTPETKCDNSKLLPGRYTAELNVLYGDNGTTQHELRAVASFWYLPLWFVAVVVVVLIILAFVIRAVVRKLTGHGRRFSARR